MDRSRIRWGVVGNVGLAAWFVVLSALRLSVLATAEPFSDLRLYLRGTSAWLHGQDPWSVHIGTLYYAAAPPSLLPMAPFALLPEPVAITVLTAVAVGASIWTLRRLGLPLWWLAWPPLVDNLWNGNPQLFLVPLLLGPLAWLAPIVKAYAVIPLIVGMRVRMLAITVLVGVVTLPFLPWGTFLARLSTTTALLSEQSQGGMSAWVFPVLVPFALIAMVVMGRERARWWLIPALWPSTQWYYSLMAMPAMTALTAAILAAPIQGGPAIAAIVAAAEVWFRGRRRAPAEGHITPPGRRDDDRPIE